MFPGAPTLIALTILCTILVEIALRCPFAPLAARANGAVQGALRTVQRAGASDHWKERALLGFAMRVLWSAIRLAALIFVLVGAGALMTVTFAGVVPGFDSFLVSIAGLVWSSCIASVIFLARRWIFGRVL